MEKKKRHPLFEKTMLFIIIVLIAQASLSTIQQMRYKRGVYDCDDMSKDCEAFFEGIGINTEVRWGHRPGARAGHCWIALETPFGWLEFETTNLQFASISEHYPMVYSDDGWIHNGYHTNKGPLEPIPAMGD